MRNNVTVRCQWMYPRDAVVRMTGMIRAGLVDLDQFTITTFGLDEVNRAVDHAATNTAPFSMTVLRPG